MRPSEKTRVLGCLCKLVRFSFSRSEHFFNFNLSTRNRIISFTAALLLFGLNALGWHLLDFIGSFLTVTFVKQILFITCMYGLVCSQLWAFWIVLTRFVALWVVFPNRAELVALSLVILIWIVRTMPQNHDACWVQILRWDLTCLRPVIFTPGETLKSV